ncbi:MAG TPA: cation:proton antiporter, partial [Candidatus Cloacimonadota bacterium]|nr:cation:proton antiporter [Candidatus Cloacimonadota bacterium]
SFGYLLVRIGRYLHDQSLFLIYSLGSLFLMCSLAELFAISPILLCMSAAIVMTNTNGIITRKFTNALTQWSPPVYLLFFVMIGTKLDFSMIRSYAWLIIVYIAFRTLGKYYGALWGGKLAKASEKVTKNLGFTLLSQAGVAIGLTLGAAKVLGDLGLDYQANQIISVMTATTFLIMLVGPVLVKYGLKRANELKVKD